MKLLWNGYELEGTPQEITEFIKMNEPVTIYDSNKTRVHSDSSCNDCYKTLINGTVTDRTEWPLEYERANICQYKKSESEEQNS